MSKKDFTDTLKYGRCSGNGYNVAGSTACTKNNIGQKPETCGLNYNKKCNCCRDCRDVCLMLRIMHDSSKENMENMKKMIEELAEVRTINKELLKPFLKINE